MVRPSTTGLRRCALAASVLYDIDLEPARGGIVLLGRPRVRVGWTECARAVANADPDTDAAHMRLACWLLLRRWIADRTIGDLAERARPLALPVGHVLHPGLDWVQVRVLGDVLDLGLGFVGLDPDRPDEVIAVPQALLDAARVPADGWWPNAVTYLEEMGTLAAARHRRNPQAALRPMGDCDVLTLLASRRFRAAVVGDVQDMRPVAVPMRTRGWLELRRIDPAFVVAAAAVTDPADRGFTRPLLLTRDEVAMVTRDGAPAQIVLRDPAPAQNWDREVLYRTSL